MATGWDSNKLKKLKTLIGKGLSTAEIGKRLEMSKNAVVGKLNRLGWNLKATTGAATKNAGGKDDAKKSSVKKSKLPITKKIAPVKPVVMPKATKKSAAQAANKKATVKKSGRATDTSKTPRAKDVATKTTAKAELKRLPSARPAGKAKGNATLAMHQRIIQHSLELAALKPNQCRWPIGDPDSENFHFCGETVFVGKPYCYEHCKQAYQFTAPKKK